jgi:hypothetical protein
VNALDEEDNVSGPCLRKNRRGAGRLLKQTYTLSLAFALLL